MEKEKRKIKTKIIIGFIIFLTILSISLTYNITRGDTVSIGNISQNLTRHNTEYKSYFGQDAMTDARFFSLTWDEISPYYWEADGTYESFTASIQRIVCMNHRQSDEYNGVRYLRPAAIIDIEGGYAKVQGTMSTSNEQKYIGRWAASLAWAAYNEGNSETDKPEAYVNGGDGWYHFYTAASSIMNINKESTLKDGEVKQSETGSFRLPTNGYHTYPSNYAYENISVTGTGVASRAGEESSSITKVNGNYTKNGVTYKTKVGPYTLSNVHLDNSKITVTVTAKVPGKAPYTGKMIKNADDTYDIYFTTKIEDSIDSITLTQSYKSYKSRIILFATNFAQSRGVMDGQKDFEVKRSVELKVPVKAVDISLQKYIVTVNGKNLTSINTSMTTRSNMKTYSTENNKNVKDAISKSNTASESYKYVIPVKIAKGDTVTYRICVYNNSDNVAAKDIKIIDRLPYYYIGSDRKFDKIGNKATAVSMKEADIVIKDKNGENVTWSSSTSSVSGCEQLNWTIEELAAGESTYYDVTLKFDKYISGSLENTAWISSSTPTNLKNYRTLDRDYVRMLNTDVSLQKYISKVNGTEITGRKDQLTHIYESDKSLGGDNRIISVNHKSVYMNPDNNKMYNEVEISYNSEVTYKIIVYNNSDWPTTQETKIIDSLPTCGVNGKTECVVSVKEILGTVAHEMNGDEIELTVGRIPGNGSVEIDITLQFNVPSSVPSLQLRNTAYITSENSSEYRQQDSDYVTIKKYSVKLEKYVDQEGENYIWNRNGHPIYDQNDFSKENNPVLTEVGNEVIYDIKLTNTGDGDIKNITFEDICSDSELEYVRHTTTYGADKLVKNGNSFTYTNTIKSQKNDRRNYYTIISITYKVKSTGKIENTAQITQITNTAGIPVTDSDGPENNIDKDWIQTKLYSVSLEKYVTAVNGQSLINDTNNPLYNCSYTDRENKPIYGENDVKDIKSGDPVKLEVYDTVTYTIKLTNTGKNTTSYGAIKNLVVTDNCPTGLTLLNCSSNVRKDSNNQFTYTGTLAVSKSATFTITYKVNESAKNIKDSIENTATVSTTLTNKNSITVTDSDEEWNNTDKDWIKIKKIAVSLEKYVSAVNGEDIANRSGMAEYLTIESGVYVDKTEADTTWTRHNETKYDNPVTVKSGDYVTYTIKVTNDGETQVRISNITDTLPEYGISKYKAGGYSANSNEYNTNLSNRQVELNRTGGVRLNQGESTIVTITVQVNEPDTSLRILTNNAKVTGFVNKNGIDVDDTTPCNNEDNDYVQLDIGGGDQGGPYTSVSVEKVWVHNNNTSIPNSVQVQLYKNGTASGDVITLSSTNKWKYTWVELDKYDANENEYIYTVSEVNVPNGYVASYGGNDNRIIITNTHTTTPPPSSEKVSKTVTKQWLYDANSKDRPEEITVQLYRNGVVSGSVVTLNSANKWSYTWNNLDKYDINKNEYIYTVQEINIPEYYKVEYEQNGDTYIIKNKYDAPDSPDVIIGGYVWNDKAFDKQQDSYDALRDDSQEKRLEGIKVYLYRDGVTEAVATTYTNSTGYYGFSNADIDKTVVTQPHKQHIKAEKIEGTQRWNKDKYYSYYVVFEYDGITYTSTPDGTSMEDIINSSKDYTVDSNAREDNAYGKTGLIDRTNFNSSINPNSGIEYYTVNEDGYIPQSIHTYKSAMKSSTNIINFTTLLSGKDYNKAEDLEIINDIQNKLKHVGLGLRGRDIFDLELTSDVDNVKVTVNGQQGVYEYNNKVTLRQEDLNPNATTTEDMANIQSEASNTYVDRQDQNIRNSDYNVDTNKYKYSADQGISAIEVTYKITVHNTSKTKGAATKITNYYDSKYTFIGAYATAEDAQDYIRELGLDSSLNPGENDAYGYKTIIMPEKTLGQAEKMEIYVVYTLNTPIKDTLSGLTQENSIPTFNMAEITEYRTAIGENQTEYTRGLIDKDSQPGSANKEQVRLTTTEGQNTATTGGNPTTVGYYFGRNNDLSKLKNDLRQLKYEDDTYATPILYFVIKDDPTDPDNPDDSSDYNRTITGIVFEDETSVDQTTKIKTGNGKLDPGEDPVYGATVELIEVDAEGNNPSVRYTTTTNAQGKFKFENFLPGYYIIQYHYGNSKNTVLLNQAETGINSKSYNGEDFQATNNIGTAGASKLNDTPNFWYAYNEMNGISTATDDIERRKAVSDAVTIFADEEMTVLNNMRAGKSETDSKVTYQHNGDNKEVTVQNIIDKTKMNATTPKMLFTVEETKFENDQLVQRKVFDTYKISNMNFGIAEVPVVTINLQKQVKAFAITDSTGKNIIARLVKNGANWDIDGDIYVIDDTLDVSIEDQKLQGARLEVTYDIISDTIVEKNFDNTSPTVATIAGLADYIDNNLSYNEILGDNKEYWEVTTYESIKEDFAESQYNGGTTPQGVLDPEGNKYTTVVRATADNPILKATDKEVATITLEKVLSSTDSTIDEIITSTVETFVYNNTVEITKLSYGNTGDEQRDRIRTSDRYIIIPGVQYDTASAEEVVIHPPTGDSSISIVYYIIAAISLTVLAAGVFGIKKFVIKK